MCFLSSPACAGPSCSNCSPGIPLLLLRGREVYAGWESGEPGSRGSFPPAFVGTLTPAAKTACHCAHKSRGRGLVPAVIKYGRCILTLPVSAADLGDTLGSCVSLYRCSLSRQDSHFTEKEVTSSGSYSEQEAG